MKKLLALSLLVLATPTFAEDAPAAEAFKFTNESVSFKYTDGKAGKVQVDGKDATEAQEKAFKEDMKKHAATMFGFKMGGPAFGIDF